jgi:hypothetical protein
MATPIDVAALTLNAKENPDYAKFIYERVFAMGTLSQNHKVCPGVKMKEQIVFASTNILSGIKDTAVGRPKSGNKPTLTEKFWEPTKVGDTMEFSTVELNALFKAYFDKIQKYQDIYNMEGTELEKFLMEVFANSAQTAANRYAWLGDKAIAVSGAAASGLINAADVKFFDAVDGLWKKIFAAVTAGSVKRTTITKNAAATFALQELAAAECITIFRDMLKQADARLKADPTKVLFVSNSLFQNYVEYLQDKGTVYDITYTTEGFAELKWNGITVRNMELLWDLPLATHFEQTNAHAAGDKPHRALLTTPDNIPVATLNENDLDELKSKYEEYERFTWIAYGFTLDTQLLEGYMAVTAY